MNISSLHAVRFSSSAVFCCAFAMLGLSEAAHGDERDLNRSAADAWPSLFEHQARERTPNSTDRKQSPVEIESHNFALGAAGEEQPSQFGLGAGFEHQFRTNIDDGGSMSATRFNAGVTVRAPITDFLGVSLGFRYDLEDFRFSGTTALAPAPGVTNPWEDIHTFTFAVMARLTLDEDWSVFGGPVFRIARESGASVSDSFMGGGAIGVNYRFSPALTLGAGVGVLTQIEDSPRLFPVILLHWEIIDNLWLTTRAIAEATGDTGLELVYVWPGGFETGVGVAYRFRRFRLDEGGGVAPSGVGQHTYIPVWGRIGYRVTPNLSVSVHGGAALGGELRLESSSGSRLGKQDYDPVAFVGANVTFRFGHPSTPASIPLPPPRPSATARPENPACTARGVFTSSSEEHDVVAGTG